MGFWIFMLVSVLLLPAVMILFGKRFSKKAPGRINHFFGYRTERSMRNQDTWDFAHRYLGGLWFRWGLVLLPLSGIAMLFVLHSTEEIIAILGTAAVFLQMIPMLISVFLTERALKRKFDGS